MEESQTKSTTYRVLALVAWCVLVGVVVYAIRTLGPGSKNGEESIAKFTSTTGKVRVQADESVKWREASVKGALYEGDRVATGKKSKAVISFDAGRAIRVGEDSLIVISSIKEGSDFNFIVEVRKGSVIGATTAAKKTSSGPSVAAPLPIQIRSGNKTFSVEPGKVVGVVKPVGEPVKLISEVALTKNESVKSIASVITKMAPIESPKVDLSSIAGAATGLTDIKPAALPTEAPVVAPAELKPKEPAKVQLKSAALAAVALPLAKDFIPVITSPADGKILWSYKSLQEMASIPLSFAVVPPRRNLTDGTWQPLIEVGATGSGEHADGLVLAGSGYKSQQIDTPFGILAKRGLVSSSDGIPLVTINYREGANLKSNSRGPNAEAKPVGEPAERVFAKKSRSLRVLAIGDVANGAVAFSVNTLANDKTPIPDGFSEPKPPLSASQPFLSVRLASAGDLKELLGFVRGADTVEFSRTPIDTGSGIYIVRSQQVVAQLAGTLVPEKKALGELLTSLRGDFIFKGERSAFVDAQSRGGKSLKDVAATMLKRGQVFYVMSAKDLVAINRDFVSRNGEVARFIENNASTIFTSQVEVLESR